MVVEPLMAANVEIEENDENIEFIEELEIPLAANSKEEISDKNKEIFEIEDDVVPMADQIGTGISWWWLLILLILSISIYGLYRRYESKKKENNLKE